MFWPLLILFLSWLNFCYLKFSATFTLAPVLPGQITSRRRSTTYNMDIEPCMRSPTRTNAKPCLKRNVMGSNHLTGVLQGIER